MSEIQSLMEDYGDNPNEKHKEPASGTRLCLLTMFVVSFLAFVVLAIIRINADRRGDSVSGIVQPWEIIFYPFYISLAFLCLYFVVSYFSFAPEHVSDLGFGGGVQRFYTLLQQSLVREVKVRNVETLNEAYMLNVLVKTLIFVVIVVFAIMGNQQTCKSCDVPYAMVAGGIISTYAVRGILLIFNAYVEHHRLKVMAAEFHIFQVSMNETRLFNNAVPELYLLDVRTFTRLARAFMWCVSMAFVILGSVWVFGHHCESQCQASVHVYTFMMVAVYLTEGLSIVAWLTLRYFRRVTSLETVENCIDMIEKHNQRLQKTS